MVILGFLVYVKVLVFLFLKLNCVDSLLGLEMKLMGEVMGSDVMMVKVFYKVFEVVKLYVLSYGNVFLIVWDEDKLEIVVLVKWFYVLGY